MNSNEKNDFKLLAKKGNPIGEVIKVEDCICYVRGLDKVNLRSEVLFESGVRGMVKEIDEDYIIVWTFAIESIAPKELVVLVNYEISVEAGEWMLGRIVNPLGFPVDNLAETNIDSVTDKSNAVKEMPIFADPPSMMAREEIDVQLETGVSIVDTLYPIARGQRQAIVGDAKSGKTTFLRQTINNQVNKNIIVVYVFIAKKRSSINKFIKSLRDNNSLPFTVIVLTSLNDSSAMSYIAPYSGCAIAEYFWRQGKDVIVVYDDLTSHAKIYRELSLNSFVSPGRESYPGDIFYIYSSLLERAGKLKKDLGGTLSAFPVVSTINGDVAGYISTSVMSMTDGQIIFSMKSFKSGILPAIEGTSVSRIGKRTQSLYFKNLSTTVLRKLSAYQSAEKYSHFGSELVASTKMDLNFGLKLYEFFKQFPSESYSIEEQQLLLTLLLSEKGNSVALEEIPILKKKIKGYQIGDNEDFVALANKFYTDMYGANK